MKTIKNILFAATVLTVAACIQEENPVTDPDNGGEIVPMTFTATADADTKVAYENKATVWKVGDMIAVIAANGTAAEFKATEVSDDGLTATFEGETVKDEKYYAVYPAAAYKGNDLAAPTNSEKGGRLYVNVPEIQTAVEGTFDKEAFVSIAQNDGDILKFKNLCSVAKFKLANPDGVKSVRFTMTSNTNLAGTGSVYTSALTTHSWGDEIPTAGTEDKGRYSSSMITLNAPDGGFKADTDYYFVQRVYMQSTDKDNAGSAKPDGVELYLEYEDNVKVRKGKSAFDADRNEIVPLGTIDEESELEYVTPYDCYNLGFDIIIAGKIINKDTFGSATLISSSSSSKGLNNNGVYFINSDVEGVSMNSSKSIVAIGNDLTKRSKITRSGYSYIPATGDKDYWILSNIDFSITTTSTYSLMVSGGGICETIIMNNCSASIPSAQQFIYGDGNNLVNHITIKDSEFLVEAGSSNNFLNFSATQNVDEINFVNNVFYSADINSPATNFILISAGNTTTNKLVLHKNTFYGAFTTSGGSITNCKVGDVIVTKNLFGLRSDATANVFVIGAKISSTMNISENGYFKNSTQVGVLSVGTTNSKDATGTNNSITSIGISTSDWNPAEGKFTLNNGFGATR